jgi:two-component system sensor histidine kinase KdpD
MWFVGVVETHKRHETAALVQNLEIIPVKKVEYRGVTIPEMDIDAVLQRHPKLALVDELAHTNAPVPVTPNAIRTSWNCWKAALMSTPL